MTKQEIIEMLWHLSFQFDGDKAVIDKHTIETIADTLLAKIEQEKKEQAKEIICRFANETEKAFGKNYLAERIAKEYGVEL